MPMLNIQYFTNNFFAPRNHRQHFPNQNPPKSNPAPLSVFCEGEYTVFVGDTMAIAPTANIA
jgi:hypothetical protein